MFKRRPLGEAGGASGSGADSGNKAAPNAANPPSPRPSSGSTPSGSRGPRPEGGGARPDGSGRRRNRRRGRGRSGGAPGSGGQPNAGGTGSGIGTAATGANAGRPPAPQRSPQRNSNRGNQAPGSNNRNNNRNNNNNPGRSQSPGQAQRQQQGRNQQQRPPLRRPPPPPPAYLQRGLVLVVAAEHAKSIDEVRTKFDPLVKKIPAHVTLLLPEPSSMIQSSFLRALDFNGVPSLENLVFTHVEVKGERYLFLVPDEESKVRLKQWHALAVGALDNGHTQDEEYAPRLTLGYIPRSMTPEDAVAFARNLITFPVAVTFEKVMLEEFEENQLSKELDALKMNEALPEKPTAALSVTAHSTTNSIMNSTMNSTAPTAAAGADAVSDLGRAPESGATSAEPNGDAPDTTAPDRATSDAVAHDPTSDPKEN